MPDPANRPPKVSIIVPNYNHARFLEQRIHSVLNQTYQDFEVILLDDASTDHSREIIARFASDPRVRTEFNPSNSRSPFRQWNKGLRLARGEYAWIAEADDDADLRLLERLVAVLDSHPNVGLVYCQSNVIDEQGRVLLRCDKWTEFLDATRWRSDFINEGGDECARYLIHTCTIPNASAVLFRRALYERAGFADETMRYSADWLMWVSILLGSDVAFVAEPLNRFRRHGTSVSAAMARSATELLERLRVMGKILQRVNVPPDQQAAARDATAKSWCKLWLARPRRLTWRDNLTVYRAARGVDPKLALVTVQRLLRHHLYSHPLLTPLRPIAHGVARTIQRFHAARR